MISFLLRRALLLVMGLFALGFSSDPVFAEQRSLNLQNLIEDAMRENPEILAAKQRWAAAKAVIPQVQTLPDPKLRFGYQRMPMDQPLKGAVYGFGQDIPFPGKLTLRGEIASKQADRIEQEYQAIRLRVLSRLKQDYWDLHFVHKGIEIVEKNKLLLRQFEKTASARYGVGKAAQQDVFRAQVELSRVLDRLAVLEQQKESLHAAINRILNQDPTGPLGTPEEIRLTAIPLSLDKLTQRTEKFSPILRASTKSVEKGEEALSLARRDFFPDFNVSAMGTRNDRIDDNGYQILLGIQIPLFYETKQSQGVVEAAADLSGARQNFLATRQDLLFQLKDAFERARRAERLIKIVGEAILPQATLALQSAQAGYGVGKVDFLTLLNNLLTLQENELELHGEMVAHEKAVARLEELTGGPLGNLASPQSDSPLGETPGSSPHHRLGETRVP